MSSLPRSSRPSKRWQQLNDRLTHWLVDQLPQFLEQILEIYGRRQLTILLVSLLLFFTPLITVRPQIWEQGLIAVIVIGMGRLALALEERHPDRHTSDSVHLLLMVMSLLMTLRYLFYRSSYTLNFNGWLDSIFSLLLFVAELYAIITLMLAYFQTLKTKERQSIDLSDFPKTDWFKVDIYIPTYNEDIAIVRKTALAALAIDYPADKKQVYVLDDGRKFPERRLQLEQMCEELGCQMLVRDNNDHAKAGNINTALRRTEGDLVLILDCDHIPVKGFLYETVGFFFKETVSLVQTPHWFYNPDPFERNLLTQGQVPVSNELFYKVLQKGNDYWNAAFFCGSAAVIRRAHVLEIGGIATETVTEDCHTSLRLHARGYESVYYDKIMVAGLAPEKFSAYVGQQVRWARGMAQILRLENPMFNRKLNLRSAQRVCYFSAMLHFFFGFPRLMYAIAPILFLLFGINSVRGLGIETLFYALPHIILSMQTNHIAYRHVRFSFWNEIYEFAISFQAGIVTLLALVNPKLGSFNVTDKGLVVDRRSFDLESVRYLIFLGALTGAALLSVPFWLLISPLETQAVLINALWCAFSLVLLLSACLVAFEQPQLRRAHRLPRQLTAIVHSDGQSWQGTTLNISESGALLRLPDWVNVSNEVRLELVADYGASVLLDALIVRASATPQLEMVLALNFINITQSQADDLTLVIYSDVRQWYSQHRNQSDKPIESLKFIATSLRRAFQELRPEANVSLRKQVNAIARLDWEGWSGQFYVARLTEISTKSLRLELDAELTDLEALQFNQPIVALLIGEDEADPTPQSLLAQVQSMDVFPNLLPDPSLWQGAATLQRVVLELSFPESLDRQQRTKIRRLLRSLS